MPILLRRRVCRWTLVHVALAFLCLALWIFHALQPVDAEDAIQSQNIPDMAQQIRVNTLRLGVLEHRADAIESAHATILWLLVANLAAAVAAFATYIVTHQQRREAGQ